MKPQAVEMADARLRICGAHLRLVRVYDDRFKDYCDPPEIKGQVGNDGRFPDMVAMNATAKLTVLLREARQL
jgi:hypothetical protein